MNSVWGFIASYLINSVWEVVAIAGAGWLGSRLLKKVGPQVEHIGWVSTLALAILAPALPFFRWLVALLRSTSAASGHSSIALVAAQGGGRNPTGVFVLPAMFGVPLLAIYVGAVGYFAVRLAWSLRSTAGLLRQARGLSC